LIDRIKAEMNRRNREQWKLPTLKENHM
jgi:hypothetical protein